MNTSASTDTGIEKDTNEDAVLIENLNALDGYLLAVADGMGGHAAGDVASNVATMELKEFVTRALADDRNDLRTILADGIVKANEQIHMLAEDNPEYRGMGTTLVCAVVQKSDVLVGNVGDSRAYRITDDEIDQLTTDHSRVQRMVDAGELTEEEAADHPQRNILTQSLGTDDSVEPDFFEVTLRQDDVLLLCSDGLTDEVPDDVIQRTVSEGATLETIGNELIEHANSYDGSDNVSVVLLKRTED